MYTVCTLQCTCNLFISLSLSLPPSLPLFLPPSLPPSLSPSLLLFSPASYSEGASPHEYHAHFIDTYSTPKLLVVADGPEESNAAKFWQMVWDQDCVYIIMLTPLDGDVCRDTCVYIQYTSDTRYKANAFVFLCKPFVSLYKLI